MTTPGNRTILVIDEDPQTVALTKCALARAGIQTQIDAILEVAPAITYLKTRLAEGEQALPLLLVLNPKMPGTAGFKVFKWVRRQPRLRDLLTVVLSSSTNAGESDRAAPLGTKTYFGKFPVATDVRTLFQLAHAMLSVDEIEKLVLPGIRPSTTAA